ncbi:hypothetical protein G647_02537 [Cladophialophora carrionii CBS 160.54]|uniref:STAS domain-containing protein n=1 Tax=Cladophialophora carrionii CBS 160.54 TaxID=1279043 RepID=V9DHF1_9EURO|nr:uncharacterized protein G647_02537 [Cladophialophora carrionii CBS 160.54]ETI25763.1 hypothetical protein G647_02537 [Cladophialophora carrionii CBS 160.54]
MSFLRGQRWSGGPSTHLPRYFPFLRWIREYRWEWFTGDLIGSLTVASLYVPLSVSFALLGHAHPISGLYSFVINPLLYALLGTCSLMVVGPEAPGSLLVGTVVAASTSGSSDDENNLISAQIAGTVTACTGALLFVTGLSRFGYVDSVLSRPLMRGVIGALGLNVLIEQTVTGLGLGTLAREDSHVAGGSPAQKLVFIVTNVGRAHMLTSILSITSFVVVMTLRHFRDSLERRSRAVAYIPDRFVVVATAGVLTWWLQWHEHGLQVLGHIQTPKTGALPFHWPFSLQHVEISSLVITSFLVALVGLFESSLTAKSLRKASEGRAAITLPANADQELIALGVSNIIGGSFLALPAFGGYGRSKLNFSTGGRTPMSNVLLSIMTLFCILFLLPAFYYLPRGVLAAMIAVVGVSMVEECPHEILFFAKIRAWPELALMAVVSAATVFHSVSLGMALGLGWSILSLFIIGGWRTTIRILDSLSSEVPADPEFAQIATPCPTRTIFVTVSGPLTFVNTNNLKDRIDARRHADPSESRVHRSHSWPAATEETALIFDMRHCTRIDGCAIQVLAEIAEEYTVEESNRIIIWEPLQLHGRDPIQHKLAQSGTLDLCGQNISFVTSLGEILTELRAERRPESLFESMDV